VINAQTQAFTDSFPFGMGFTGGLFVSSGYVNGDGNADVIVAAGQGGGPHVIVYDGASANMLQSFFAYAASFTGGVRVGATDFNKDGFSDVITGQGSGGTSQVKVFSGTTNATLATFNPYGSFGGGEFVAGSFRQLGSPLMAAGGQTSGHGAQTLQQAQLDSIVRQAITNYSSAGLSADQIGKLKSIKVGIADLKDGMLGEAFGSAIYVDTTAAGYGFFVDTTPGKDEEFTITRNDGLYAAPGSVAAGKIDLLTVVEHEMGHILGLEDLHSIDGLMHEDLGVGIRHHIDDAVFGDGSDLFDGI
jgi:hypothetical protein